MTTQTIQIVSFDYGASLSSVTLRSLTDDSIVATADTCNEVSADAGVYAAVFGESSVIPSGNYRLRAVVSGAPLNRYVTLAGTDGEVVQSSSVPPGQGLTTAQAAQLTATKTAVDALSVALAGSTPVEPTGTNIRDQLQEIYDGLFPADPDIEPVVITPGAGDITTGWMVCLDETGEAEKDVSVYCQMSDVPSSETGFAHSSRIQTATSAANGVVEFSLVKGASYFFWRGKASPNGTLDPVAIPSDAGSTYELPSIKAIV